MNVSQLESKDADSRDKHYRCYHGTHRIVTIKHSSRGNLTSKYLFYSPTATLPDEVYMIALINHMKTFPYHYKLYELLRNRDTPPTSEEIQFANASKPFNGEVAKDFLNTLEKTQRALDSFCQNGKQVYTISYSLYSR